MGVTVIEDEFDKQPDLFHVDNKKAGYRYRLLNVNNRNIASKLRAGYEIVQSKDPEKLALGDATPIKKGQDLDGTQRVSDVVLARIPEEQYQKIVARNQSQIKRQTQLIVKDFDKDAGPLGYNPNRDPTGHATRYHAGTTQTSFDKENLPDKEFESKYGMPKGQIEE